MARKKSLDLTAGPDDVAVVDPAVAEALAELGGSAAAADEVGLETRPPEAPKDVTPEAPTAESPAAVIDAASAQSPVPSPSANRSADVVAAVVPGVALIDPAAEAAAAEAEAAAKAEAKAQAVAAKLGEARGYMDQINAAGAAERQRVAKHIEAMAVLRGKHQAAEREYNEILRG